MNRNGGFRGCQIHLSAFSTSIAADLEESCKVRLEQHLRYHGRSDSWVAVFRYVSEMNRANAKERTILSQKLTALSLTNSFLTRSFPFAGSSFMVQNCIRCLLN